MMGRLSRSLYVGNKMEYLLFSFVIFYHFCASDDLKCDFNILLLQHIDV